jgi:hypothetical protein
LRLLPFPIVSRVLVKLILKSHSFKISIKCILDHLLFISCCNLIILSGSNFRIKQINNILTKSVPEFPKEVKLVLPQLNKIQLPKLPSTFIKILKPLNGFSGRGIKIVTNKSEIEEHLKQNENKKYNNWILQDYIINPDLINKHKFHFRILILVKVDQSPNKSALTGLEEQELPNSSSPNKSTHPKKSVYIFNKFIYTIAEEEYKKDDFLNKKIHDTHYKPINQQIFPNELPDQWSKSDAIKSTNEIYEIIKTIFKNEQDFKPAWNAINGFEIFGVDIMFENKKPYLIEINEKMGYKDLTFIIPDLIDLILEERQSENITKLI